MTYLFKLSFATVQLFLWCNTHRINWNDPQCGFNISVKLKKASSSVVSGKHCREKCITKVTSYKMYYFFQSLRNMTKTEIHCIAPYSLSKCSVIEQDRLISSLTDRYCENIFFSICSFLKHIFIYFWRQVNKILRKMQHFVVTAAHDALLSYSPWVLWHSLERYFVKSN